MLTKYEELCTPLMPFLSIICERPKEMLTVVISIDGVIGLLGFSFALSIVFFSSSDF